MYGLNAFPGKRSRLENHIGFMRELDLAIDRDGIQTLNFDEMKKVSYLLSKQTFHLIFIFNT